MKLTQNRIPKLSTADLTRPLTEAQSAFSLVLGQCLVKEWMPLTIRTPQTSRPNKLDSNSSTIR